MSKPKLRVLTIDFMNSLCSRCPLWLKKSGIERHHAQIVHRRQILQGMWNLRRVLSNESPQDFKEDEPTGLFPAGKRKYGEMQKVQSVFTALP